MFELILFLILVFGIMGIVGIIVFISVLLHPYFFPEKKNKQDKQNNED